MKIRKSREVQCQSAERQKLHGRREEKIGAEGEGTRMLGKGRSEGKSNGQKDERRRSGKEE